MMKKIIREFFQFEAATGILLIAAMVLAMIFANSPWSNEYHEFWHIKGEVRIGSLGLEKSLLHWVNDGLMAMFFMLVGLELKREIQGG